MDNLVTRDYSHVLNLLQSYELIPVAMLKLPDPVIEHDFGDLVDCGKMLGIDLINDARFIRNYMNLCYKRKQSGGRLVDVMASESIQSGSYEVRSLRIFPRIGLTKAEDKFYTEQVRRKLGELGFRDYISLVRYFLDAYEGDQPEDAPRKETGRAMYEMNLSGIEKITMNDLAQILFSGSVRRAGMRLNAVNI